MWIKVLSLLLCAVLILPQSILVFAEEAEYENLKYGRVTEDVISKHPQKAHPRLFADAAGFENIKEQIANGGIKAEWFRQIKRDTIVYSEREPIKYGTTDGIRMRVQSGQFAKIVSQNAFLYRITGEESYARRAWTEIEALISWDNWNPYHFLDTGQFMNGMALGYDWLYDYLSEEQRKSMREALLQKGLKPICDIYDGKAVGNDGRERVYWWAFGKADNWTLECGSGAIMAALSICDEDTSGLCDRVLSEGIKSFSRGIKMYSPDGAWYEGVSYWQLATETAIEGIESLVTAAGSDYGLSDIDGFSESGFFPINMTGLYTFNFSDAGELDLRTLDTKELFWFAERFSKPYLAGYRYRLMEKYNISADYREMFYLKGNISESALDLKKDFKYDSTDAAVMRNSWDESNMLFCALHAGDNAAPHGHLDIGEFIIDSMGNRFACDLGLEDYNLPGKFFNKYRNRAEGHNTLVFNPDDRMYDQKEDAHAKIDVFESGSSASYAITDMTCAYSDYAESVKRGIMLSCGRKRVTVTDEIKSSRKNEIYWFMHTRADVSISSDGKSAVLSFGNNRLIAEIVRGETFEVMDAVPLPGSPTVEGQNENAGYRKLAIHMQNVQDTEICVAFTPEIFAEELEKPSYTKLDEWEIPNDDEVMQKPRLSAIKVNGRPVDGFSPDRFIYETEGDSYPEVSALGDGTINIAKPDSFPGTIKISVTKNGLTNVYAVRCREKEHTKEGVIYTALKDKQSGRLISISTQTVDLSNTQSVEKIIDVPEKAEQYIISVLVWTKESNKPVLKKFLEYKE